MNIMEEKKLKILLVDDDAVLREMYAEIFQSANFEVLEANDGLAGLDKASTNLPDVIFTGIIMPRMDGFDMMEALKKTVMTANIPVVISSHMGRGTDMERAMELGAKDFIIRDATRPVEVVKRIKALFDEAGAEYRLRFDTFELDANRIAKELNFQPGFLCLDCNERLVLNLKTKNAKERIFETKFVCPNCGK